MAYRPDQFGSFDGLDNRRWVMDAFVRMGDGVPEEIACNKRAIFLRRLIKKSTNGFSHLSMGVTPCDAVQAYHLFVAITGALNVPIEVAAKELEQAVR